MNPTEWIGISTAFTPVIVAFGVVQVRMHSTQQSFAERIARLERSEDQQNTRQTHIEDAVHGLNAEMKSGFSRLEAMLSMLVRDRGQS